MEIKSGQRKNGFSLVEMLIYIALLISILLLVINTILSFASSYRQVAALRLADNGAIDSMERMTREIRDASSVNVGNSSFGVTSGVLSLSKAATTTRFYLQNGALQMDLNGVYAGPLTASSTSITSLTFTLISTTTATAVKIDMTIQGVSGPIIKIKQLHSTVVLRGV